MAGPEQQAANQQQAKRSAESEPHPVPVAKRAATQEPEVKDVQDGGTVQPSADINHVEAQAATHDNEAQPTGDLKPIEQISVDNKQEDGVHESAQPDAKQDTDEATGKQREVVEAAEEAVKEAVAATVPTKATTHDEQESIQNGATETAVAKSADGAANGTGQV